MSHHLYIILFWYSAVAVDLNRVNHRSRTKQALLIGMFLWKGAYTAAKRNSKVVSYKCAHKRANATVIWNVRCTYSNNLQSMSSGQFSLSQVFVFSLDSDTDHSGKMSMDKITRALGMRLRYLDQIDIPSAV